MISGHKNETYAVNHQTIRQFVFLQLIILHFFGWLDERLRSLPQSYTLIN